ncbi:MAG: zf-HC2 domain-containing protein [Holophagaceae bacterium]|nr:zf-HC2 domain-containing protein [Holophagaceae bacterium]
MTLHVLDQLPFWVEGDLPSLETAQVEAHLARCSACREAADHLAQSQAWLREALASPFWEPEETTLRREVMAQIHQARPRAGLRPLVLRRALLAACATLLLALLTFRPWSSVSPPPIRGTPTTTPSPPLTSPTEPRASAPLQVAEASPTRSVRRPPPSSPEPFLAPALAPTRIEFQTADPTIRIIWLAQATPLAKPVPLPQEKS